MSDSSEHLGDMKKFIGAVYGPTTPEAVDTKTEYPIVLEQAEIVSRNLAEIGLDRLSILFTDRSSAEIVLENCITLTNKLDSGDWHTAMKIAEAFGSIFSKIEKDRYGLAGLNENEINIFTGNAQILSESFAPTLEEPKEDSSIKLVEGIQTLIERWEMQIEDNENEDDRILAEGIELGYARAASELANLLEKLSPTKETDVDEKENRGCL